MFQEGDRPFGDVLAVVRGAGELGTGVAYRLHEAGFQVAMTELELPTCVCQAVSFAEVMRLGQKTVEGIKSRRTSAAGALDALRSGEIAVVADPSAEAIQQLRPAVVVDAIMAKRNTGTRIDQAPVVLGLGPGFTAGQDVHAVVETKRGHRLGRVITAGAAEPNTGVPELIDGQSTNRLLLAPRAGRLTQERRIGDWVRAGEVVARVDQQPVVAAISGLVRGLLPDGYEVEAGTKVGDLDPAAEPEYCYTLSDRALAVGSGVLAAILDFWPRLSPVEASLPDRGRGRRPGYSAEGELLSAAEFTLLGLLHQQPAHGYELARSFAAEGGLARVVRLRVAQLYAYLSKLETLGLIRSQVQHGPSKAPRDRKVFTLTEGGERQFEAWLARPVPQARLLPADFLAKLFFAEQLGAVTRRQLIRDQLSVIEQEVRELGNIETQGFGAEVTLAGLSFAEAGLAWLRRLDTRGGSG
ncbi:MAG TPA: selenium-dependent molybdenum cofactor biosynthesis protein YqeB [Chloroflexota bacterium]|nr:selenium-dependent molybdenum cofactor biosynthesis protein YqeB [Chloroflexota bacterium]